MWGHEVRVAHRGEEALQLAAAAQPDVILLDIGLPNLDGHEVVRRLRAQLRPEPHTRIVALTGYGQPDDRRRAEQAGFDLHLTKPADLDALQRLLES
jgi:CheY-like chemotaxis protein